MTHAQARTKFYTEYAEGSRSMADADLQITLNDLKNDVERNIERAKATPKFDVDANDEFGNSYKIIDTEYLSGANN